VTTAAEQQVTTVALPAASAITRAYSHTHLADAYAIALPAGTSPDPEVLARFLFAQQAPWALALMKLRDSLVAALGLKTSAQLHALGAGAKVRERVGIFRIYSRSEHEIVLGEDDRHLDFRLSVSCQHPEVGEAASQRQLVLATVVHCHNRLGRCYIAVIAPFHRWIIASTLRRAARKGWPSTP
jgi:Protein of unknown function (DUF2867)